MREVIITDLTRFSTDENVCTAVIDVQTGECLRPMPYLTSANCKELGMQPGGILKGNLTFNPVSENPHVEDASHSNLEFHGPCSSEKFLQVLDNSLSQYQKASVLILVKIKSIFRMIRLLIVR